MCKFSSFFVLSFIFNRFRIAFSLISQKARNLSKIFCKLSASSVDMTVKSDHLYICVEFEMWIQIGLEYYFYAESAPQLVNAMFQKRAFTHKNSGLSASQWVERVLDVTNCESIDQLDLKGSPQVDVCDTFGKLQNIYKLSIFKDCTTSFAKKALEIILPVTREITFFRIQFETREEFQTFLKSNLNYLTINACYFSMFTFDDLLVTNILKLKLREVKLSSTDFSQFLTKWFHSKDNSRLEHLTLCTLGGINETCLPEVLNAVPFPVNEDRMFCYSKQLDTSTNTFRGGYDIRRADGKKATIKFVSLFGRTYIDFYVWP